MNASKTMTADKTTAPKNVPVAKTAVTPKAVATSTVSEGTKHVQAAMVLIVGTAASLLFHQDRVSPPSRPVAQDLLVRRAVPAAETFEVASTQLTGYFENAASTDEPVAPVPQQFVAAMPESRVAARIDSAAWNATMGRTPVPTVVTAAAGPPPRALMKPYRNAASQTPTDPTMSSVPANAPRKHKVADGDTLAGMAERYYGDPRRYVEIFEANRGLLRNPEVLPIGVTLDIPGYDPTQVRPAAPPPTARLIPRVIISGQQ